MLQKLGNILFKLIIGIILFIFVLYVNMCIFMSFVIPSVNYFDAYDIIIFYFSIGNWIITNIKALSLMGTYTVIANEPQVPYLLIKYFGIILVSYGIPLIIIKRKWANIKAHDFFKPKETVFGDAKWADPDTVIKAGLRSKAGMLVGKDDGGLLISTGYQHALLFAPTGSGKGVGVVIPNLLFWKESIIVHDIKGENYEITSGWRESIGQKCYVWNPAEPDGITHCYNPLDWISTKPGQMVDDVQKLATLILPKQEFWENEARSLFLGVVLYLLADSTKIKSFGQVVRTLRSDDVVYNLSTALDILGKQMHPVGYMNLAAFLQKPDKERGSVISTLNSAVELWSNPLIDTATATSDFNVQMFKKVPTTVYVCLTPDNLKRLQPLLQIFYQQSTEFLTRKMPDKDDPFGVMYLLDEFPTLGKMDSFMSGLAFFRGYHVRLYLIIQDTQQLKAIYEESGMNSFLSNTTYRITYAANNVDTATLISQLCGNKTVKQESYSKPKLLEFGHKSVNVSEVQRALLLPQEVIALPKEEQILLIESFPPIKCKKIIYYADSLFTQRLMKKTAIPTQLPYSPNSEVDDDQEQEGATS